MADAGQHFGALLDMAFDAFAHGEEGLGGAAHLRGAVRLEVRHGATLAEGVGGARQPLYRTHLVAQEQDCHRQKDQCRTYHPGNE